MREDGNCKDGYPFEFRDTTEWSQHDIYPLYRRRAPDGEKWQKLHKDNRGRFRVVTNANIVPHNQLLCLKYNCHINVQVCAGVRAVKYLFKCVIPHRAVQRAHTRITSPRCRAARRSARDGADKRTSYTARYVTSACHRYVYKGHDRLMYRVEAEDEPRANEVKKFEDARIIGSSCAAWHLQGNAMSKRIPAVHGLDVHLEDEQRVVYERGKEREVEPRATTLTEWFKYIKHPPAGDMGCRAERYLDFHSTHVWKQPTEKTVGGWTKRSANSRRAVGNLYTVSTRNDDFYLRLLLTQLTGNDLNMDAATDPGLRASSYTFAALRSAPDEDGAPARAKRARPTHTRAGEELRGGTREGGANAGKGVRGRGRPSARSVRGRARPQPAT